MKLMRDYCINDNFFLYELCIIEFNGKGDHKLRNISSKRIESKLICIIQRVRYNVLDTYVFHGI